MLQQERFGQQRRDEIAGDELAGAVDEEAAVGVAVPGDADVGLLGDHALDDVAAVLLDERVGLVVRKAAVDLEAQPRRPAGQPLEQLRRDQAAHAAAGVEHDVERLDDRRVDERHDVLDVGVEHVLSSSPCRAGAAGGGRRSPAIMSRMSRDALVAAQRERLLAHHLHAVVLLRVVRRGDLRRRRRGRRARPRSTACRSQSSRSRRRRRPATSRRR